MPASNSEAPDLLPNAARSERERLVTELLAQGDAARRLHERARSVRVKQLGNVVYFRGLIEFSNRCVKNCLYCGIRKDIHLERFSLSVEEAVAAARWAFEHRYGSVVLQAGERSDPKFVERVATIIAEIRAMSEGRLGITLSLGEQTRETYARWMAAGAHRYLLRIETSNPALYRALHPADHDYEARLECLRVLRELGYQVGTGVMVGVPGQTIEDLADDVLFFRELDVDMIGMGPYVVHEETPLGQIADNAAQTKQRRLELALNMVAVCRLAMPDINIVAATALQALHPRGRELGLQAGANIVMPIVTPVAYRKQYQLYQDKPCLDDGLGQCKDCLEQRIASVGDVVGYANWGDAPHALRRGASAFAGPSTALEHGPGPVFDVPIAALRSSSRPRA